MNQDESPALPEAEEPAGGVPRMVPGHKWIRAMVNGQVVVDSRAFTFVWEIPYWPTWFFRSEDLNGELKEANDAPPGHGDLAGAQRYDFHVAGKVLTGAAKRYPDSPSAELRDLVTIDFAAVDRWFEEDVEVFVHPRSPFTRIDALASSRHVVVSVDDVVLADSHNPTMLFETGAPHRHYLPMTDVNMGLLEPSPTRSSCPYKGDAAYWSISINDRVERNIAWSYRTPMPEATPIAGLVCFYDEKLDVDIDGVRQPRPDTHFA
jgi:uncharacterized protein (DUF427 family)